MKKICCLGTCVGPDALRLIKNTEWKLAKTYISYSIPAILHMSDSNAVKLQSNPFVEDRYNIVDLFSEINGEILTVLKKENFDLLLVDLCDFRLTEKIFELENGISICITNRPYSEVSLANIQREVEKVYQCKIKRSYIRNMFSEQYEKVAQEIMRFVELLYGLFGKEKVMLYCSHPIIQYLDKGKIILINNYKTIGNINYWIENVLKFVSTDIELCSYPYKLIGDTAYTSAFEFHYCKPYYDYLSSLIKIKLESGIISDNSRQNLLRQCEDEITNLYSINRCRDFLIKYKAKFGDKNTKLVPVAPTKLLCRLIKEEFGYEAYNYINYNKTSDLNEIAEKIREIKKAAPESIFLVSELFFHGAGKGLTRVFYDCECLEWKDYLMCPIKPFTLTDFSGHYKDICNNEIHSNSEVRITINGNGCYTDINANKLINTKIWLCSNTVLTISNDSKGVGGQIRVFQCGNLSIGERTSFCDADIACHAYTRLTIGNDCLFSWGEMIFSGDGHAIFEILDNERNNRRLNPNENDSLTIGNHVWLGYRCHILSGADIGDGCIVGAGSLVNKKFPNNCVIAGMPAKIIKKNRAWSGNPLYKDLKSDKLVFENYANLTDEDKNG